MTSAATDSASPLVRLERALSTLAILKVNWDQRRDYIENFVPLVAAAVRDSPQDEVSLGDIQQRILLAFGLMIPQGALKTILGRMAREKLIAREHGIYRRRSEALEKFDLAPAREEAKRQHEALVTKLVGFAQDTFGRSWSRDDAEAALLGVLEGQAEHILRAAVEGGGLIELPRLDQHGEVVVNRFILELVKRDPAGLDYLVTVVKGTMLANVLYLPKAFASGTTTLGGTAVYFDTPFLLRALGFTTAELQEPCVELISLLTSQGAPLRVFVHTLREVEAVLASAAAQYRQGSRGDFSGDVVEFFVAGRMSASDVEMQIASLGARLAEFGIEVVPTPNYTEGLGLDEAKLEEMLKHRIRYRNPDARAKDIQSLTAIHRLRAGELFPRLDTCPAIFVTTNSPLVSVSRTFFREEQGGCGTPLCVLDSTLAAIVWLADPRRADDLPRKQLVATSYAALNPSDSLWRKYVAEIRRLREQGTISENQVGLLVFSSQARAELVDRTMGDGDAYAEGTVMQILEFAEAQARAETEAALAHREAELAAERKLRLEAETRASDAATSAGETLRAHEGRLEDVSKAAAKVVARAALVVATLIVIIGAVLATSDIRPHWLAAFPEAFVGGAVIVAAVLGALHLITGISVKALASRLEAVLATLLEKALRRLLLPRS
jgi:hypothetical protein